MEKLEKDEEQKYIDQMLDRQIRPEYVIKGFKDDPLRGLDNNMRKLLEVSNTK